MHLAKISLFVATLALLFNAGSVTRPAGAQETDCSETYTIQQGDWLSKIAEKYFGDVLAFDRLVAAANASPNDEYTDIANPDLIEPGWVLCIALDGDPTPAALHKTWQWEKQVNPADGSETAISNPASYTLTFNADGTYQFQADCNSGSGSYTADESGAIRFQPGPVTLAECGPDSRYNDMLNMMQAVQDYRLEESGAVLVLVWPAGGPEDVFGLQE